MAAPMGMTFYMGDMFPAECRDEAFVAMRGSARPADRSGCRPRFGRILAHALRRIRSCGVVGAGCVRVAGRVVVTG